MKVVEVRRHTHRDEQQNLTDEGRRIVSIAKRTLGRDYSAAYSSPAKRAILTLQEFGFKDYKIEPALAFPTMEQVAPYQELFRRLGPSTEAVFSNPDSSRILLEFGRRVLEVLAVIADSLPEEGRAFAISHGGTMEATVLSLLGSGPDLNRIGGRFHVCEGFMVYFVNRRVERLDLIRLPEVVKAGSN